MSQPPYPPTGYPPEGASYPKQPPSEDLPSIPAGYPPGTGTPPPSNGPQATPQPNYPQGYPPGTGTPPPSAYPPAGYPPPISYPFDPSLTQNPGSYPATPGSFPPGIPTGQPYYPPPNQYPTNLYGTPPPFQTQYPPAMYPTNLYGTPPPIQTQYPIAPGYPNSAPPFGTPPPGIIPMGSPLPQGIPMAAPVIVQPVFQQQVVTQTTTFSSEKASWYWQGDDQAWVPYDEQLNERIENAYVSGSGLELEIHSTVYRMDFNTFKQVNERTGYGRKIERRVGNKSPPGPAYWEWEDNSNWELFDKTTFTIIEAAYQANEPTVLLTHGFFAKVAGGYLIDFRAMEQTNNGTGFKRNVRRVEGDVSRRGSNPAVVHITSSAVKSAGSSKRHHHHHHLF